MSFAPSASTRRSRTASDSSNKPIASRSSSSPSVDTPSAAVARDGSTKCHFGFTRVRMLDRMCGLQAGSSSKTKIRVS
jgi:hypothetical protein